MMMLKVISQEMIKPSVPTPKHLRDYNLSLLDHMNGPMLMPIIFFYCCKNGVSATHQKTNKTSINTTINRLNESLAITLSIFYPLAGRIEGDSYVVCSDEGVLYVHGRANCHLRDVVNKVEVSELGKLLPCKSQSPSKLILAIQVSVFECGGIAIALCFNHKVTDAFSVLMFMKTWSIINRGEETSNKSYLVPCFDFAKLFSLNNSLPKIEFDNGEGAPVCKRFTFDVACISALKAKYYNNGRKHVSSGLILLAFIYSRIVSISQSRSVQYQVSQAVNVRSKINKPPLKESFYFGNVYVDAIVKHSMVNKTANICLEMVEKMRESMMKINTSFLEKIPRGIQDLSLVSDHLERAKIKETIWIGFTNYSGLPIYESDFGWGKPAWVTFAPVPMKNFIALMPNMSGSHVDASVYLSQEDMNKLDCDREFTTFAKNNLRSKF